MNNLAPFVRVFTNTLGNGRWFDSFVNDLLPTVLGSAVCGGAAQTPLPVPLFGGRPDERHPAARRRARRRRSCSWPRWAGRSSGPPASTG